MKKTFLLVMMLAVVSVVYAQENKRYGIKSGIIKLVATVGNHATNETQYFDNYGGKESVVYTTEIPGLVKYDSYIITVGDKGRTYISNFLRLFYDITGQISTENSKFANFFYILC